MRVFALGLVLLVGCADPPKSAKRQEPSEVTAGAAGTAIACASGAIGEAGESGEAGAGGEEEPAAAGGAGGRVAGQAGRGGAGGATAGSAGAGGTLQAAGGGASESDPSCAYIPACQSGDCVFSAPQDLGVCSVRVYFCGQVSGYRTSDGKTFECSGAYPNTDCAQAVQASSTHCAPSASGGSGGAHQAGAGGGPGCSSTSEQCTAATFGSCAACKVLSCAGIDTISCSLYCAFSTTIGTEHRFECNSAPGNSAASNAAIQDCKLYCQ